MAELFDMKELEERVILVAVSTSDEDDTEASLDELEELADTAGATAIGRLVQNREKIHPGTYLGSGKIGELREMVWEMGATGVICDDELSPASRAADASAVNARLTPGAAALLFLLFFAFSSAAAKSFSASSACPSAASEAAL